MENKVINGYGCYLKYLAIKSHFLNDRYDYFQYNGGIRANPKSYAKRTDKLMFEKLARLVKTESEVEAFFVSNFILDSHVWVGDTLNEAARELYLKWRKRIESVSYLYKQDLIELKESTEPIQTIMFECKEGQHPILLKLYLRRKIMLETLVILDKFFNFFTAWDKEIKERIIWPEVSKKCKKYRPFVETFIDKTKFRHLKSITKQILID
jgi:hypothetical protein